METQTNLIQMQHINRINRTLEDTKILFQNLVRNTQLAQEQFDAHPFTENHSLGHLVAGVTQLAIAIGRLKEVDADFLAFLNNCETLSLIKGETK